MALFKSKAPRKFSRKSTLGAWNPRKFNLANLSPFTVFYGTDRTNECICAHAKSTLSHVYRSITSSHDGSAWVRLLLDIK